MVQKIRFALAVLIGAALVAGSAHAKDLSDSLKKGTPEKEILFNGLAVNPLSGNAYLSVSRGRGPQAAPAILKVDRDGKIDEFGLKDVKFSRAALPNAIEGKNRQ